VARREAEVAKREMAVTKPIGGGISEISSPTQQRLSRDEMMKQGSDSPLYREGSGSYYSETFAKPIGDVAPQSSFGAGNEPEIKRRGSRVKGSQSK
jgi:hypothetical protein